MDRSIIDIKTMQRTMGKSAHWVGGQGSLKHKAVVKQKDLKEKLLMHGQALGTLN